MRMTQLVLLLFSLLVGNIECYPLPLKSPSSPQIWLYLSYNLQTSLDPAFALIDRAAAAGYTGTSVTRVLIY